MCTFEERILPEICKPCLFIFAKLIVPYLRISRKSFEDWLKAEGLDDDIE